MEQPVHLNFLFVFKFWHALFQEHDVGELIGPLLA